MPAVRRNHRAEARGAVERQGPDGPVGAAGEMPLCGHTDVWSWNETTPLVCQACHPKPGTRTVPAAVKSTAPTVTSRLHPSPWRDDYRDPPSAGAGSGA